MESREPCSAYEDIARELISSEPALRQLAGSKARVCYLVSDKEKRSGRKSVYAECEKVPDKWKWAVPYDFAITVFAPNVERFTEGQMSILLLHELLHIGIDVDGNEETYHVEPHDVEDFRCILEAHGMDWSS